MSAVADDEKHVARLMAGARAWNEWRALDPSPVQLFRPYLKFAQLQGANLAGVETHYANLQEANLAHANLEGAGLGDAYLAYADLTGTNLRGAYLFRANLRGAKLAGADVTNAFVGATDFLNVDLSHTVGLEACHYANPSSVDFRTLLRSRSLPLQFLRGCGLPDRLIDYLSSLGEGEPIQFYSCFISYATANQDFAERLHADLQARGIRCWFAPHDMQPGRKVHDQIDEAIRLHDRLLLILSKESMTSSWVKTEIAKAREKEVTSKRHVLFPIALVPFSEVLTWKQFNADLGEDTAREIREYFLPNFSDWKSNHDAYHRSLQKIVVALKSPDGAVSGM